MPGPDLDIVRSEVGSRLLRRLCRELASSGCRGALLGVNLGNERGVSFFRRHGFRTVFLLPGLGSREETGSVLERLEAWAPLPFPVRSTRIMAKTL